MKIKVFSPSFAKKAAWAIVLVATHSTFAHGFRVDSVEVRMNADSLPVIRPMGLFDLNAGASVRAARGSNTGVPGGSFSNSASGFSARLQSSVRWSYKHASPSKLSWGDVLGAEVFAGHLSSSAPHSSGPVWLAYKFEFGWGGRWRINANSDAGLNLILLAFSRDNVSGNISGSAVQGRYRYKRVLVEAGVAARQERVFGVVVDLQKKIPMQLTFTGRYLLPSGRNIGVNVEVMPARYFQDNAVYSRIWSLKLFYGLYF